MFARDNESNPQDMVEVFIRGDLDADLLQTAGAFPGTVLPGLATARIPSSALLALAESSRIEFIEKSHPMKYHLDRNAIETLVVTEMWGGSPPAFATPPTPEYIGNGILVGIVDTGIDLNHMDFRKANGDTRVRFAWDQTAGGSPPAGYTYGREWTASQINSGSSTLRDFSGHGTHIAGAAAGNGSATGNGKPQYVYTGMAPGSDLVVVKLALATETRVLDAVSYIFAKATALGMDAVVCLALGTHYGPHDGSSTLEMALDGMTGPGRIIVASAGNDGETEIHASTTAQPGGQGTVSFIVPSYVPGFNEYVNLDCWYNNYPDVTLSVVSPRGYRCGPISHGQIATLDSPDGLIIISTGSSTSGSRKFLVNIARSANALWAGEWRIEVASQNTFPIPVDFWIADYVFNSVKPYMLQGQTPTISVTSPATADNVIAVGAYTVKKSWTTPSGTTLGYSQAVMNDIANFSSIGPRRDGVTKPEIVASGFGVASSRSVDASISSIYVVEDGVHYMMTGTSVAAAIVTGAVATLLDEFPGLTPDAVRNILRVRARRDSYTDNQTHLAAWGAGKLCLEQPAVSGIGEPVIPPPHDTMIMQSPYPNPMRELTRVPVDIPFDSHEVRVAVYDVQGRQVRLLHSGPMTAGSNDLLWDGRNDASVDVPSGSYYVVATDRTEKASRVVIVTR